MVLNAEFEKLHWQIVISNIQNKYSLIPLLKKKCKSKEPYLYSVCILLLLITAALTKSCT